MLVDSAWPDRTVHVVTPAADDHDWLAVPRLCTAVLDLHRADAGTAVIDLASDRWVAIPQDGRGGSGPLEVFRYDLVEQQQWAEDDLRALPLPRTGGRWADAVITDVQDEEQWALTLTCSTATLGLRLLDAHGRTLAVLEDAGAVITVALSVDEARRLAAAAPSATIHPLDDATRLRGLSLLAEQAELRERGRPEHVRHLLARDAERRRQRAEDASWRSPHRHPADDYRVEVSVTTRPLPGRPAATARVQLRSARLGPLRLHDSRDRIHDGVFPISLHALSAGVWPDGGEILPCYLHADSQRVTGDHAVLVGDVPGRDLVPGSGRPPLSDGWGMFVPWAGWSMWVENAAEDDVVITTPVSWTRDLRDQPGSDWVEPAPDAVVEVTVSLRIR